MELGRTTMVLFEIRLTACIAMLALSAVIDIRKREIPDKIWVGFGAFGVLLAALQFTSGPDDSILGAVPSNITNALFTYMLGIGIMAPIGYALYKTGLFGGADSKALIAIAVLMPSYDAMPFRIHGFTALTVLTNAVFVSLSQLVINCARNAAAISKGVQIFEGIEESGARKALAFAMGYRSTSTQGYLFPMEGIEEESGKRKFVFNPSKYNEFVEETEVAEEHGEQVTTTDNPDSLSYKNGIWVTQALPFIVYIAIGFAIASTVGDLLGAIFHSIVPLPGVK